MSATAPEKKPGPTASVGIPFTMNEEGDTSEDEESKEADSQEDGACLTVNLIPEKKDSANSICSEDDSGDSVEVPRTILRADSILNWKDQDINNLHKELEAEKRFLKTAADMSKIKLELKKIKTAGGQVVNLHEKVEGLETALKTAAKDKYNQEREMVELRNELAELRQRNDVMEGLMQTKPVDKMIARRAQSWQFNPIKTTHIKSFQSCSQIERGLSIKFEAEKSSQRTFVSAEELPNDGSHSPAESPSLSPLPSPTAALRKMKEQEALMASLHRKIDFLQLQNKDKEVDTLKSQVTQLSETIEKLIGGIQNVSKNNPEISAQLHVLKKTLPNVQKNELRNTLTVPGRHDRSNSAPLAKPNTRQVWCTKLKPTDFSDGPVSFVL